LTFRMARYPNWRQVDALTSAALATIAVQTRWPRRALATVAPFGPDDPQLQKFAV
jgi:hypothetical protein